MNEKVNNVEGENKNRILYKVANIKHIKNTTNKIYNNNILIFYTLN